MSVGARWHDGRDVLALGTVARPPLQIIVLTAVNRFFRQRPFFGREVGVVTCVLQFIFPLVCLAFPFVGDFISGLFGTRFKLLFRFGLFVVGKCLGILGDTAELVRTLFRETVSEIFRNVRRWLWRTSCWIVSHY